MNPLRTSQLIEWHNDRGFGFIADEEGDGRIFLHIRELANGHSPPCPGDSIAFVMGTDPKGRVQAVKATNLSSTSKLSSASWFALLLLMILPVAAFFKISFPIGHFWVAIFAVVVSSVTYFFYSRDKRMAVIGGFRISEIRLHVLELIGGWPGAFIAQRRFRHKCSKRAYRFGFWLIVLCHQLVAVDALLGGEISYMTWTFIRPFLGVDY